MRDERASVWRRLAIAPFLFGIRGYQVVLAPIMSGHCRFLPTCSNYALDAYRLHGAWRGTWLTARRLARCHPWGGHGFDPVPGTPESATPAGRKKPEREECGCGGRGDDHAVERGGG